MSDWAPKRFWTNAEAVVDGDGFTVLLDGRTVRTPAKAKLVVPTHTLAQQIADEWEAQEEKLDPTTMPWTRSANAAIDKVSVSREEIEAHLIDYAGTDLLCYRASSPDSLVECQKEAWDPIISWAQKNYVAEFVVTQGVMPVAQSDQTLGSLAATMPKLNDFELTGFYDLVTLSGSFLIALAVTQEYASADSLWASSRVDENWQSEHWGADEEALEDAEIKKSAFLHATAFYKTARNC